MLSKMFFLFMAAYIFLFVIVEIIQRQFFQTRNWARKATHIGAGFILYPMPKLLTGKEIIILAAFFTLVLIVSRYKKLFSLHDVQRKTIGEILYPFTVGLLALICLPVEVKAFQLSCLSLAFSDGMAAVVGEQWPLKEVFIFRNKKSLGGALAFALSMVILVFVFPSVTDGNLPLLFALIAGVTFLEFVTVFGFDNLVVPVATALFILFL